MSTIETVQIFTLRYRDDSGLPTCAIDFEAGHVCRSLGTKNFGAQEVRMVGAHGPEPLYRRGSDGRGMLIPTKDCEMWNGDPQ